MNEDYLWDRSGERDAGIAHLERVLDRLRWRENWCAKRPFRQVWPTFAGPSSAGLIEAIRPPRVCASRRQPTPQ